MRRLLVSLFAAGLLAAGAVGCRHVAGICDCDYMDPCYTRAPWSVGVDHGFYPAAFNGPTEQLKVAPKTSDKN